MHLTLQLSSKAADTEAKRGKILGGHPTDDETVRALVAEARGVGASDDDICNEVRAFLHRKSVSDDRIKTQLEALEPFLRAPSRVDVTPDLGQRTIGG